MMMTRLQADRVTCLMREEMTERQQRRRRSIITFGRGIDDRELLLLFRGITVVFRVFAVEDDT